MKGGITWDEAWSLTFDDRKVIGNTIKDAIERSQKTKGTSII